MLTTIERTILTVAVTFLTLHVGLDDPTDPTPELIRLPIVGVASTLAGWFVWEWTDKPEADGGE